MSKVRIKVEAEALFRGIDRDLKKPEDLGAIIEQKVQAAIEQAGAEATVKVESLDG